MSAKTKSQKKACGRFGVCSMICFVISWVLSNGYWVVRWAQIFDNQYVRYLNTHGSILTTQKKDAPKLRTLRQILRRGRDSNPRYSLPYTWFRIKLIRPLWHLSVGDWEGKYRNFYEIINYWLQTTVFISLIQRMPSERGLCSKKIPDSEPSGIYQKIWFNLKI